jgi:hypothetical protein
MNRQLVYLLAVAGVGLVLTGHSGRTSGDLTSGRPGHKFPDFDTVVKGAKSYDGLFRLYQKDDQLLIEIKPSQLDTPFLCPISIARGLGQGGHMLNSGEQWVLVFRKVGDRLFLIRRNVRFKAEPGSAVAKAVETTYADSVLMSLRILSEHPNRHSVLISLNDIFMTDFAQLRRGQFDASRSTWHKIKTFPRNIELQVAATYAGGRGGDSVIDSRGATVVIHYGMCELPESGYTPRLADDRVGYFLSVVKDYTNDTRDTPFVRYITPLALAAGRRLGVEGGRQAGSSQKEDRFLDRKVGAG